MKQLFIHVGIHKTASSSIQKALFDNRTALKKEGYCYPSVWPFNHNFLYGMFCENPNLFYENVFAGRTVTETHEYYDLLKSKFLESVTHDTKENIIISSEDLSVLPAEGILRLKDFFLSALPSHNIKIVIYLREPLSFITSDIQQRVKTGYGYKLDIYKNLFRKRLQKFIDIFGYENLIVLKFEESLKLSCPVSFFLKSIGVKPSIINNYEVYKFNESISQEAFDIISFINKNIPIELNGRLSEGRFHGDTKILENMKGSKFNLLSHEVDHISELMQEDLAWLEVNLGFGYSIAKVKPFLDGDFFVPSRENINFLYDNFHHFTPAIKPLIIEYLEQHYCKNNIKDCKNILLALELNKVKPVKQENVFNIFNELKNNLEGQTFEAADILREVAFSLEKTGDLQIALRILEWAHVLRPNGEVINEHIQKYKDDLF